MNTTAFWIVIVSVALGTFVLRSLPFWVHGRLSVPSWLEHLLRRVPAAALAALVVSGSVWLRTEAAYAVVPERVGAIVVAALVAFRWRNMLATLLAGMTALWLFQAVA